MIEGLSPSRGWEFSPHHPVQTGYVFRPAYPMCTRGSFTGGKGAEAWRWPFISIQYRGQNCVELYFHSPNTPSCCGAQLKRRDNFNFTSPSSSITLTSKKLNLECLELKIYIKKTYARNRFSEVSIQGYRRLFLRGWMGWYVNLTTHLPLIFHGVVL
jgi:hypothetical protein